METLLRLHLGIGCVPCHFYYCYYSMLNIAMKETYYILDWPECQEFLGKEGCFTIQDEMMVAVPTTMYNEIFKKEMQHIADVDYKI